jgi:chemotaxis protein methyltransferase CheR
MAASEENLKKDLSAEEFSRFRDWIHKHSGIYLEDNKLDSLRISLVSRATRFGFVDYDEYYRMLVSSDDEFKELMNLVTINETSFFRFPAQFEALRDRVIPEILASKSKVSHSFRVWSAGCSTGEEPYTLAMTLLDSAVSGAGLRLEVLGTDVSTSALERARKAVYPARSLANVSQTVVQRWFEPVPGGHRPIERVRDLVKFSYHNLVKEPYPTALLSSWDVIFCRNVTIYFRLESTKRVVNNFFESLNPGGYLFIGHSETLSAISDRFEAVEIGGVFLYRKPLPRRLFSFDIAADKSEKTAQTHRRGVTTRMPRTSTHAKPSTVRRETSARPKRQNSPVGSVAGGTNAAEESAAADADVVVQTAEAAIAEAKALLESARPAEAREAAEKALAIEPRNVQAILVRAYANADSGDFDAATADANAALAIDPLLAPARYVLGIIYQRAGDERAALGEFKRTIYIDHEFVLAHFNAANIYRGRGAVEDACREYENALSALRSNPSGSWTVFLGGFRPDLLAKTCERSLLECRKGS